MRIGLDFDGTIADVTWAKMRYAREAFGVELAPEHTWRAQAIPLLGEERYAELIHAVHGTDLALQTPPLPGALEVIARLGRDHELYVVTARLDEEVVLAREWLDHHGARVRGVVHTARGSKAATCAELGIDVHLDDTAQVLADLDVATLPALLDAPYNRTQARDDRVCVVEHWGAFEALVWTLAGEREDGGLPLDGRQTSSGRVSPP